MFHSENNELVIVPSSEYVSHGSYQAKETLCEMLKNPEQFLNASWTLITLQDQQFLLRLFKCNNAYLGVCVPTDSMIQKLKNYSFSNTAVTIAPTGTFTDKNSILDFFSYGIFKLQLIHLPEIFQYFYLLIFHCRIILLLSYVGL